MIILLVEDNPGDVGLIKIAFRESKLNNRLLVARDGEEALQFLRHEGAFTSVPRPDLILLDLNLPKKDGREVLSEIKADESLASIPVIVLTTSEAQQDICRAYNLHANCYLTKPVEIDHFLRTVRGIEDFWFTLVRLPKPDSEFGPS